MSALIAALTTASLVWFSSSSRPDADSAARASLLAVAELERAAFAEGSAALDAAGLAERDPSQFYIQGPASSPGQVSVVVSGTSVLAAALSDGGSCWMLRLELVPSPLSPPAVWWVAAVPDAVSECSATGVLALSLPPSTSPAGSRSDFPIVL